MSEKTTHITLRDKQLHGGKKKLISNPWNLQTDPNLPDLNNIQNHKELYENYQDSEEWSKTLLKVVNVFFEDVKIYNNVKFLQLLHLKFCIGYFFPVSYAFMFF